MKACMAQEVVAVVREEGWGLRGVSMGIVSIVRASKS